jgi:hypothetical protein
VNFLGLYRCEYQPTKRTVSCSFVLLAIANWTSQQCTLIRGGIFACDNGLTAVFQGYLCKVNLCLAQILHNSQTAGGRRPRFVQGGPVPCTNIRQFHRPTVDCAKNCARWAVALHNSAVRHEVKPLSKVKNRRARRPQLFAKGRYVGLSRTDEDSCVRRVCCLVFLGTGGRRTAECTVVASTIDPLVLLKTLHTRTMRTLHPPIVLQGIG